MIERRPSCAVLVGQERIGNACAEDTMERGSIWSYYGIGKWRAENVENRLLHRSCAQALHICTI